MNIEECRALVVSTLQEVMAENGLDVVELRLSTRILRETEIDSMGLAVAVLKLEETTGKDPFSEGFILFETVDELAALYVD